MEMFGPGCLAADEYEGCNYIETLMECASQYVTHNKPGQLQPHSLVVTTTTSNLQRLVRATSTSRRIL